MQHDIFTGKVPPQAVDIEEAVLGYLLFELRDIENIFTILKPEMFYKNTHILIFSAMVELYVKHIRIDIISVTQKLKEQGKLEEVGGPYQLTEISNKNCFITEYHCFVIREMWMRRMMIEEFSKNVNNCYDLAEDVLGVLDGNIKKLYDIRSIKGLRVKPIGDISSKSIVHLKGLMASSDYYPGIKTMFSKLDSTLQGLKSSDFIVIAARPSMGKTAFMCALIRNIAGQGMKVGVLSLEMGETQIMDRFLSMESGIPLSSIIGGTLTEIDFEKIKIANEYFKVAPIYIDDTPNMNIVELRSRVYHLLHLYGLNILFVDYIQLMKGMSRKGGNREEEVSEISRELKALAKEIGIPVVALAQLNREVEKRSSPVPKLSDLRESGAIEQDADVVIFLYRPEYYNINIIPELDIPSENMIEIIIAKHRQGKTGSTYLEFHPRIMKFRDYYVNQNQISDEKLPF